MNVCEKTFKKTPFGGVAFFVGLWIFRYLTCSHLDQSLPFIGSFATRYFSHLFDPSRFVNSLFFAVIRRVTINSTGIHQ